MYDRIRLLAAGLVASVLLVAACGSGSKGPGVAGAGTSSGSQKGSALAYSRCMRSHGISDFPDPNANGEIELNAGPGSDLAPDSPQFKTANNACKSLLPAPPSPAQQRKDFAQALKFAKCMRSHGIQMPDPQPPSSGPQSQSTRSGGNGPNIDPNSPQFKNAQQACQSLLPKGKGGFSTHEVGGGK